MRLSLSLRRAGGPRGECHPAFMGPQMGRLLTLKEAAAQLNGKLTAASLRGMARQGKLQLTIIAGKHFVTPESLNAMLVNSTLTRPQCPADDSQPDSISDPVATTEAPSGSSSTDRKRLAQAQAQMIVQRLKRPLKRTLRASTDRPVARIRPPNSSSRR